MYKIVSFLYPNNFLPVFFSSKYKKGLPVSRQSKLAALLVGNLGAMMDVSASARKNACKTLTAMILQCPAAKV